MQDEIEIDRTAIGAFHKQQNLEALNAAVERGEWTQDEAAQAYAQFMKSELLQTLITRDVQAVEAVMKGRSSNLTPPNRWGLVH